MAANQIRARGHTVNDVPARYGGEQCINLMTADDGMLVLNLVYREVMCYLPYRKPRAEEMTGFWLETFTTIDLTLRLVWNPVEEDDQDDDWDLSDNLVEL